MLNQNTPEMYATPPHNRIPLAAGNFTRYWKKNLCLRWTNQDAVKT